MSQITLPGKIMIKRIYTLILLAIAAICLLSGCGRNHTPSDILTEQEMAQLLIEIYLAEAKVLELHVSRDSAERVFVAYEQRLFEKMDVPEPKYKKSYQYYLDNPKRLERIYTAVVDSLNLREQRMSPSAIR